VNTGTSLSTTSFTMIYRLSLISFLTRRTSVSTPDHFDSFISRFPSMQTIEKSVNPKFELRNAIKVFADRNESPPSVYLCHRKTDKRFIVSLQQGSDITENSLGPQKPRLFCYEETLVSCERPKQTGHQRRDFLCHSLDWNRSHIHVDWLYLPLDFVSQRRTTHDFLTRTQTQPHIIDNRRTERRWEDTKTLNSKTVVVLSEGIKERAKWRRGVRDYWTWFLLHTKWWQSRLNHEWERRSKTHESQSPWPDSPFWLQ
jgi:hypothetical protein